MRKDKTSKKQNSEVNISEHTKIADIQSKWFWLQTLVLLLGSKHCSASRTLPRIEY